MDGPLGLNSPLGIFAKRKQGSLDFEINWSVEQKSPKKEGEMPKNSIISCHFYQDS